MLKRTHAVLPPVSRGYPPPLGRLPTRYSPVRCSCTPEGALPLNLHVLSTPPAFILSQDQTLQLKIANATPEGVTVISNDEFNHYSNLIVCLTTISHRFDRGPSVSRSSFQRACARIGPTILGHTLVTVKPFDLGVRGAFLPNGSATIRKVRSPVNPFSRDFFSFFGPAPPRLATSWSRPGAMIKQITQIHRIPRLDTNPD